MKRRRESCCEGCCGRCSCCCRKDYRFYKGKRPIGIVIATYVADEVAKFIASMDVELESVGYGGRNFVRGVIFGLYVVAVTSGIGIANVSMTTQMMQNIFEPRNMIFLGVAGGVNPEKRIGTLIIAKRFAQYQYQKSLGTIYDPNGQPYNTYLDLFPGFPDRYFTYEENKVLPFKRVSCVGCDNPDPIPPTNAIVNGIVRASGMDIPMEIETLTVPGDAHLVPVPQRFLFYPDPYLVALSEEIIKENPTLPTPVCFPDGLCYNPQAVIGDFAATADSFADNAEYRDMLFSSFLQAGLVTEYIDMESAAFAHTCVSNGTPFIVARVIACLCDGTSAGQLQYFLPSSAANLRYFVTVLLEKISQTENTEKSRRKNYKTNEQPDKEYVDRIKSKYGSNKKCTGRNNNSQTVSKKNKYQHYLRTSTRKKTKKYRG